MTTELIRAFFLIFIAEMGDKTQIIAMTFATQYKVREVLLGVFLGVFFNHGLAVILGKSISKLMPMNIIQIIAGFMFVSFGLLALREEEAEDDNRRKFSPVLSVALAFFIGELGDKTQLTAMTLSAEGDYPLFILMGTTLGMIATSGLGIFIGSKIGEKIPDFFIKIVSSIVFVFFGTLKLYEWLPKEYLNPLYIRIYFLTIIFIELILIRTLIANRRYRKLSPIKEVAQTLYIQTKMLNELVEDICLGKEKCGKCSGSNCIIGYTKNILENARENEEYYIKENVDLPNLLNKNFDKNKVIEALSLIIVDYIKYGIVEDEKFVINQARESMELILFGTKFIYDGNLPRYLKNINKINSIIGKKLESRIDEKL